MTLACPRPPLRPSPWARALAFVVAVALGLAGVPAPSLAQVQMPALGDGEDEGLSVAAERRLGEQAMREIRRDPAYLDDPVLLEYLQSLWRPLVEAAQRRGDIGEPLRTQFSWEIFLVRDRSVNAFALPGGYVGVHLGLVAITGTRDELASVLAHELSHVSQRHISRSVASAGRQSAAGIAAILLGVLAASRANSPDLAQAAIAGGQAAMIQGQLNFSRDMEREADRIGYGVLQEAGFVPSGMARMFEKLDQAARLNDSGQYPYLRSHPLTVDRMAEARTRAGFSLERETAAAELHALMQARARVLMDEDTQAWSRLAEAPRGVVAAAQQPGALYAAAHAQARLRDFTAARASLDALERIAPGWPVAARRVLALLRAEVELAAGKPDRALEALQPLQAWRGPDPAPPLPPMPSPASRPELLLQAQAVVAAGLGEAPRLPPTAWQESAGRLQAWVSEYRADAAAWQLLAQHREALGQRLAGARARAEVRAALGDLAAAIDILRGARRSPAGPGAGDFIEASVIDARLRQLEQQRREIAQELRGRRSTGAPEDDARTRP